MQNLASNSASSQHSQFSRAFNLMGGLSDLMEEWVDNISGTLGDMAQDLDAYEEILLDRTDPNENRVVDNWSSSRFASTNCDTAFTEAGSVLACKLAIEASMVTINNNAVDGLAEVNRAWSEVCLFYMNFSFNSEISNICFY